MNKELILDIFRTPAQSGRERAMQDYIVNILKNNNVEYKLDDIGNVYNIDQEDKPLLCAHMDTVQDDEDAKLAEFINLRRGILSGYGVIGGDDKCGIYIILDLLINGRRDFNFLFCVEEEIGLVGSSNFVSKIDISFIPYGIVLDRRGQENIICTNNNYGTKKFENIISKIGKDFGYSPTTGASSDADRLSEQISCANLSVGYFNPHSKNEFVIVPALVNAEKYVESIIDNIKEKFKAPPARHAYYGNRRAGRWNYDDNYYNNYGPDENYPYKNLGNKFNKNNKNLLVTPGATSENVKENLKEGLTGKQSSLYDSMCRGCDVSSKGLYHLGIFDDGFGEFFLCEECIMSVADRLDEILISLGYKSEEL